MIGMIRQLEEQGIAYQAEDRSVYFRLSKFRTTAGSRI